MRRARGWLFFAVCIAFAAGAVINVMGDNAEVLQAALRIACGDGPSPCGAQMTRMERTPFSQTFDVATKKGTIVVTCKRALVLFGEYTCTRP